MKVADVRERAAAVFKARGDDEAAHTLEDDLYRDVLRAIAKGTPDAQNLAFEALETQGLSFSRWCA